MREKKEKEKEKEEKWFNSAVRNPTRDFKQKSWFKSVTLQKPERVSSKTPGTVREEDKILETEIRAPMAMEVLLREVSVDGRNAGNNVRKAVR